jgi:hypothetical protein
MFPLPILDKLKQAQLLQPAPTTQTVPQGRLLQGVTTQTISTLEEVTVLKAELSQHFLNHAVQSITTGRFSLMESSKETCDLMVNYLSSQISSSAFVVVTNVIPDPPVDNLLEFWTDGSCKNLSPLSFGAIYCPQLALRSSALVSGAQTTSPSSFQHWYVSF